MSVKPGNASIDGSILSLLWIKGDQMLECAPGGGQFQAAVLTVCRV